MKSCKVTSVPCVMVGSLLVAILCPLSLDTLRSHGHCLSCALQLLVFLEELHPQGGQQADHITPQYELSGSQLPCKRVSHCGPRVALHARPWTAFSFAHMKSGKMNQRPINMNFFRKATEKSLLGRRAFFSFFSGAASAS